MPASNCGGKFMRRNSIAAIGLAFAAIAITAGTAAAQDTVKIGLVMPMTGTLGPAGQEAVAGAKLYMAQHGDTVAGKKIELIVRDDGTVLEDGEMVAPELLVD